MGFEVKRRLRRGASVLLLGTSLSGLGSTAASGPVRRYLYVGVPSGDGASPKGGISVLVFDTEHEHPFVRRMPIWPKAPAAETIRGMTASLDGSRLYISTTRRLGAIETASGRVIWQRDFRGHCCERMAVSGDGRVLYAPAFGRAVWYVVDAARGVLRSTVQVQGWPRSTVFAAQRRIAYLGAWESNLLTVLDGASNRITGKVGPFSGSLCPFTINQKESLVFANVDGLVGFEVGDLHTGLVLDRVQVDGYSAERLAEYECPSHGLAFTPDERELWVADGVGNRLRIFDSTTYPPVEKTTIQLTRQPRWITFSRDGRYAYASTGDVVDVVRKAVVGLLRDERGAVVESERMIAADMPSSVPR